MALVKIVKFPFFGWWFLSVLSERTINWHVTVPATLTPGPHGVSKTSSCVWLQKCTQSAPDYYIHLLPLWVSMTLSLTSIISWSPRKCARMSSAVLWFYFEESNMSYSSVSCRSKAVIILFLHSISMVFTMHIWKHGRLLPAPPSQKKITPYSNRHLQCAMLLCWASLVGKSQTKPPGSFQGFPNVGGHFQR